MSSLTTQSTPLTKRPAAQKGHATSGDRAVKGRADDESPSLTDAFATLLRFALLPGQRREITGLPTLINGPTFNALLADKAVDPNHLRAELERRDAQTAIPTKRNTSCSMPKPANGDTASKTTPSRSRSSGA